MTEPTAPDMAVFLAARIVEDDSAANLNALVVKRQRLTAEVLAKRVLLELHQPRDVGADYDGTLDWKICSECGSGEPHEYPMDWPCDTLRAVAAVYADHPDYCEDWR